jgi:hypothetical protein
LFIIAANVLLTVAAGGSFATQGSPRRAAQDAHQERATATSDLSDRDGRLISHSGFGRIRLDMTLQEARRALPAATFQRDSDGDGAALVLVRLAPDTYLTLSADEDDPNDPIDWSKRITYITTSSPAFHTVEGVRPGDLVAEVEKIYGKTQKIEKSEIESREFIQFETQPPYLTFRLDYTGLFPPGTRVTTRFQPGAKILAIGVARAATQG